MSKNLTMILGIMAILGASWGSWMWLEGRYALCGDVKMVEQRLDWKIMSDQVKTVQERIWVLEDRYRGKVMPDSVKEEYRRLQEDKKRLEFKLVMFEKAEEKK